MIHVRKIKDVKIPLYKMKVPSEIGIVDNDSNLSNCDGCHVYGECDEHGDPPCICDEYNNDDGNNGNDKNDKREQKND